ncbi:MAG: SHOCT domain-containing protein [Candidatus Binatia bacterium]
MAGAIVLLSSEAGAWNGSDEALISSVPSGANVFIDDQLIGTTPLQWRVPCSEVVDHKFRIEYHDCHPIEGVLYARVAPGRVVGMIFSLGISAIFQCPYYFVPVAVGLTGGSCSGPAPAAPAQGDELERRLKMLKDLRERGVISEPEYQREREEALNGL